MREGWKEFLLGPPNGDELHVTIDRKGTILIGAETVRKFGSPAYVVLMHDARRHVIGLAPATARSAHAFPLIKKPGDNHRLIRANRFCRYYGISPQRTTALKAEIDPEGVLVLDLFATRAVGGRNDK